MKDSIAHVEMLYKKAKDYTETSFNLYKLQAIDNTADIVSSLVSKAVLILILSTFLLFLNVGLSLYIGESLNSLYLGFFIVSGVYLLIGVALYLLKRPLIEHPVSDLVIAKLHSDTTPNTTLKVVKDEEAI